MKAEAWTFGSCTIFFAGITPTYWFVADELTGTLALLMTTLLALTVTVYLGFHAVRMEPRPEDLKDGEIADGAGELGFFPPYSWWPLWAGLTLGTVVFALALQAWFLAIIGAGLGFVATSGWIYEYYRGEHAH